MSNLKKNIERIDLEPLGGIAGDMFAAALFNAAPYLYDEFVNDLDVLSVTGLSVTLEDRMSNGLLAKHFTVSQDTTVKPPRTLAAVEAFFKPLALNAKVVSHVLGIFTLLAGAEAKVHGKTIETIHFHEVSDWDSVVDILAAAGIIARLDCNLWRVGALPLGGGSVNTAHGDIPVPAPATVALLEGFQWHDDGVGGERVTPTGAAILGYLQAQNSTAAAQSAPLIATGSGCGTRELEGRANLLRVMLFGRDGDTTTIRDDNYLLSDTVVRISFEVDDMTAEEIAYATNKLRDSEGVIDVVCISMHAKKNRVATGIRILVSPDESQVIISRCMSLTSTLGVRYENIKRKLIQRSLVTTPDGKAKLANRPENTFTAKAESDDLYATESLGQRRELASGIQTAAGDAWAATVPVRAHSNAHSNAWSNDSESEKS